ncbi:MAG: hypothetical protein ABWY18_13535 [Tardiphaga sp.]
MAALENAETIELEVEADAPAAGKAAKKSKVAKKKNMKTVKVTREASTIQFPYRDLGSGISVAQAMIDAGGVALSTEQLAGVMGLQAGSGNFVMKVATARIFGLVANVAGKYELTDTGFAIVDGKDEKRQRQARAEAFLKVPLYKRTYDEFRSKQLPPRPHGLEQAFVRFGVSAKQKEAARLAFDKSAAQAGFFAVGQDRLVEPIIVGGGAQPPSRPPEDDAGGNNGGGGNRRQPSNENAVDVSDLHPFIQGLLDTIPEPGTNWAMEGRAKWLQAAANIFDLIYKGSGEIHITAKADPKE